MVSSSADLAVVAAGGAFATGAACWRGIGGRYQACEVRPAEVADSPRRQRPPASRVMARPVWVKRSLAALASMPESCSPSRCERASLDYLLGRTALSGGDEGTDSISTTVRFGVSLSGVSIGKGWASPLELGAGIAGERIAGAVADARGAGASSLATCPAPANPVRSRIPCSDSHLLRARSA